MCNRKMIRKTWLERGIDFAGELALYNVTDMVSILKWNIKQGIKNYRMSSAMFPWMSEYKISDLPQYEQIKAKLQEAGQLAKNHDLRLTYHPGAFTILSSPNSSVCDKAIKELDQHSEIMDLIGLPVSPFSAINIHIGGAYGDKKATLDKFCVNFQRLHKSTRNRLTIENDDRKSLYTIEELMCVHDQTGIPLVFDFHHYDCHPGKLSKLDSLNLALSTWPDDIMPLVHMSSSRRIYEDASAKNIAHADYLYEEIPSTGIPFDVDIEAKAKELAVIRYQGIY